jgi:hypothetical protein
MALFPIRRPRLGLSIGAHTLGLVEVTRAWSGLDIRRCCLRELPAGLVRPSASDPNISDVGTLVGEVRALLGGGRRPWQILPVALSLPDLCARVALFEFEAWPRKPAEGGALLRWRFQKELNVPAADARLAYRLFPSGAGSHSNGTPVSRRVLAAAVPAKVMDQYEQVCEEAGLLPLSVGLSSLALFDLCRPAMLRPKDGEGFLVPHEVFFLSVTDGGYSFFALRDGSPVFLRMKPHRYGMTNGAVPPAPVAPGAEVSDGSPGAGAEEGQAEGQRAVLDPRLAHEVVATIQFYDEGQPGAKASVGAQPRPFYVVGSQGSFLDGDRSGALRLAVIPLNWEPLLSAWFGSARPDARTLPLAALPALAGAVVA